MEGISGFFKDFSQMASNFGLFYLSILTGCCLHQGFVIQKLESVHFLFVFFLLLLFHLFLKDALVLLVNVLKVLSFAFLVLEKVLGVFFPNFSLLFVNFLLFQFLLFFFLDLSGQVVSHLLFLFLLLESPSLLFFLFSFELIVDMLQHFFVFKADLLLLVLDDGIGEGSHDLLNLFLSLAFFLLPFPFEFILEPGIFLLHFDILELD